MVVVVLGGAGPGDFFDREKIPDDEVAFRVGKLATSFLGAHEAGGLGLCGSD